MRPCPATAGAALVLALGIAAPGVLQAAWTTYEGAAVSLRDGSPAYTERHFVLREPAGPVERLVLYLCPDGEAFARKRVRYADSPFAPAFELHDGRDGYREGARRQDDTLWLFSRTPGGREREGRVALDPELVADAGFDEFVRRHWDRLVEGERLALRFALPARGEAYRFRVQRVPGTADELRVRLQLRGVLSLFADGIDVAYDLHDRRLLRYEGLSNLRDDEGRQAAVRIDFPEPARPAGEDRVEAARRQELGACSG